MKKYWFYPLILCLVSINIFQQVHSSERVDEAALWKGLASGKYVALLRHAIAPGFSDPQYFELDDCTTQRNLSEEGREQARAIGERFRKNGVPQAEVFSSQWCRCLDTADLLALGKVNQLPVLNSFFEHRERENRQTRGLQNWLRKRERNKPAVLVSHQVNISALTGVYPGSGELVIIEVTESGEIVVAGTLQTNAN